MEIQPSKPGAPQSIPSVSGHHHPREVIILLTCLQSNTSNRHIKRPTSLRRRQRNHPPKRPQRLRHLMIALHPTPYTTSTPLRRILLPSTGVQAHLVFAQSHDWILQYCFGEKGHLQVGGWRIIVLIYSTGSKTPTHSTFALTQALERNISVRLVGQTGKIGRRDVRILRDTCEFVLSVKTPYHYRSEGHRDAGALWIMLAPRFGLRNDRC